MTLSANQIIQRGVLRAPLGEIRLGQVATDASGRPLIDKASRERTFTSTDTVSLLAGSLTSVAATDRIIPLGKLLWGSNWTYEVNANRLRTFDAAALTITTGTKVIDLGEAERDRPWNKRIIASADNINFVEGATLDLSGGGDVIAPEFRPSTTGTRDILGEQGDPDSFALLPLLASQFAPLDPSLRHSEILASQFAAGLPDVPLADLNLTVEIGQGSALPAGTYAVLPRGYAVVPGAYLVTSLGTSSLGDNARYLRPDGVTVVTGRFGVAGTAIRSQGAAVALAIESREQWLAPADSTQDESQTLRRAEYLIASGNKFFTERALVRDALPAQLPRDGGQFIIGAQQTLTLGGTLAPNHGTGRSSQIDITGQNLAVVTSLTSATDGRVEILASQLNALDAESLLLGGVRSFSERGIDIDITATNLTISDGTTLSLPELMLAAQDTVTVESGAVIDAQGEVLATGEISFAPEADGTQGTRAFLRVSGGKQRALVEDDPLATGGNLNIEAGAQITGAGSVTIDASQDTLIDGQVNSQQGSVRLKTGRISIGEAPIGTTGLVVADLGNFNASELELISRSTIDFYGAVDAQTHTLILDTQGLVGYAADVNIETTNFMLANSGKAVDITDNGSSGSLNIIADTFVFGAGDVKVRGFAQTSIGGEQRGDVFVGGNVVTARGEALVDINGNVNISSEVLTSDSGSLLSLTTKGNLDISSLRNLASRYDTSGNSPTKIASTLNSLGGRMHLSANNINHNSEIVLASGQLRMTSANDITLGANAVIDVAGTIQTFADLDVPTYGGSVELTAANVISISDTAQIDVAGAVIEDVDGILRTADAGSLSINAPNMNNFSLSTSNHLNAGLWTRSKAGQLVHINPAELDHIESLASVSARNTQRQALADTLQQAGVSLTHRNWLILAPLPMVRHSSYTSITLLRPDTAP